MSTTEHRVRRVDTEMLTRVEGEGGLHIVFDGERVVSAELEIFEPPRYFEAVLRGRAAAEAPDITARICGICPVAYQTSSCLAVEAAADITLTPEIADLRRLLYCGEWIQSHALHVFLLHAPDFFGCADAVELAERDRGLVELGLRLKRVGNEILKTVGGRAIHPVNVRVGGFYRAPAPAALHALRDPLRRALDDALAAVAFAQGLEFPDIRGDYRFVALRGAGTYPIEGGARIVGPDGLAASPEEFAALAREEQSPHSTALHARLGGLPYLTGPLARFAHNADLLTPFAAEAAAAAGLTAPCTNPFKSILVRCVELVVACEEALRIVENYAPPDPPAVALRRGAGHGFGASEAPRGILLIGFTLDDAGDISSARIMPPTAQNQLSIEEDLRAVAADGAHLDDAALQARCELAVRNHDPCISCAAHFLDLSVERR